MFRPTDASATADPFFNGDDPLLDLDALDAFEAPPRLSRDEGRAAAGPDWSWTHLRLDEEPTDD